MGALFVVAAIRLGLDATLPAFLLVVLLHSAVTVIEYQGLVVPLRELRVAAAVGVGAFVLAGAIGDQWPHFGRGVVGGAALVLVLWAMRRVSCRVTAADVELGALGGLALAWAGWLNMGVGVLGALVACLSHGLWGRGRPAGAGSLLTFCLVVGLLVVG